MKSNLSACQRVLKWSVLLGPMIAPTFYVVRFAPFAARIVGSWPASDSTQVTINTFKPNGDWESVTVWKEGAKIGRMSDGSEVGVPLVFKGHYSTNLNIFRVFDVTRYLRVEGKDVLWVPSSDCVASNTCGIDSETVQSDKEASDPKFFSTVISADWWTGKMTVRSSPSSATTIWTRQ